MPLSLVLVECFLRTVTHELILIRSEVIKSTKALTSKMRAFDRVTRCIVLLTICLLRSDVIKSKSAHQEDTSIDRVSMCFVLLRPFPRSF